VSVLKADNRFILVRTFNFAIQYLSRNQCMLGGRVAQVNRRLVSSLERDPLLKEQITRLRTVPGVGPINALTWALEIGDFTRFASAKQVISYGGLCGDQRRLGRRGDVDAAFQTENQGLPNNGCLRSAIPNQPLGRLVGNHSK
jgi:hypothetical protein